MFLVGATELSASLRNPLAMANTLSVAFVCFLLFSTLWAAPVNVPRNWKSAQFRNIVNKAWNARPLAAKSAGIAALGGAITCDGMVTRS